MPSWFTYILRCTDGSLYIGITNNIELRLKRHNAGTGGAYTRSHRPVVLAWKQKMRSATAARKREAALKKLPRAKKLELLKNGP